MMAKKKSGVAKSKAGAKTTSKKGVATKILIVEARYYENKKLLGRVEELERRLPKGFDPNSK